MKLHFSLVLLMIITISCENKNSPEYVTKQYLWALKNKDWEKAKTYCSESAISNLDCSLRMGHTDFHITEIRDIKCETDNGKARCKFCCMFDDPLVEITLHKMDGKWLVGGTKESCPDELPDSILNPVNDSTTVE